MKFSKRIVIAVFLSVTIFVVAVFWFSWHGRTIPDSLIVSVMGFLAAEVWALAFKTSKGGE